MEPSISMPYTNAAKGLLNAPGDNNCFLNSAVQVLWHLDAFRRSFRQISGHTCMGNGCIFCALKVIFVQFQYSDQPALPPDALRKALAKTFADQHRFQLGLMDDAAECFENILLRIHFHLANQESEDMCNAKHCIPHQKFAMTLVEQATCVCGATSEPLTFTQMVHYVSASALVSEAKSTRGAPFEWDFAELLKAATNSGDIKTCPSKCGKEVQLTRTLMNTPDVVSIGLIWDSDRPTADHIKDVVRSIGTVIKPANLFSCTMDEGWARSTELHLVGVVCYYGKHYSTFFFHTPLDRWYSFDDSTVRDMGSSWDIVVEKCCRGHYQPLLLLYANKQGQPVSVATAPDRTVIVEDFDPGGPGGGGGPRHARQKSTESTASSTCGGQSSQIFNYETTLNDFVPGPVAWNPDQRSISPGMDGLSTLVRVHKKPGADIVHFRQSSYLSAMDTVAANGHCNGYPNNPTREQLVNLENSEFLDFDYNRVESKGGHEGQYGRGVGEYTVSGQSDHPNVGQAGQLDHRNMVHPGQQDARYTGQTGQLDNRSTGQYPNNALDMWQGHPANQNGQTYINNQQQEVGMTARQSSYHQNVDCVDGRVVSNGHSNALHTQPERYGYQQQPPENPNGYYYHQQPYQNQPIHQTNHQNPSQPGYCDRDRLQNGHGGLPGGNNKGRTVEDGNPAGEVTPSPALKEWLNTHVQQLSSAGLTMKRTKSMEDTKHVGKPATGQVPVSRRRPQSARPFDYGNSRPVRTAHDDHWQADSRTTNSHPQWNITQNLANSQQTSRQEMWNREKDISEEDIYISSKTVQHILQRQRSQVGRATPDLGRKMTTPVLDNKLQDSKHQQNDQSAVITPCDLLVGPLVDALKVDIPPDNTSLSSQRDSGYRSGESGGDRNSASSTSSTYAELGMMTSHDVRQPGYWPVSNRTDCVSYSSSESLNWTDKSSCGSVKLDRVSEIPHTANDKDGECERLCLQAEGLMDLSRRKEHEADLAVSLVHCTKALGYLQEALALEGCTQEMRVHSRTRHSACVLRSRSLHKKILSRQVSNPSTAGSDVNGEDHSSLSSLSTDQDSLDSKPEHFSGDKPRCPREATKHVTAQKSARRPEMQGRHTPVSEIWKTYTSSESVPGRQSCTPTKQMLRTLNYSPVNDTRSSKNSTPTNDIAWKDTRGKDVIEQCEYNYKQHVEDKRIINSGRLQSGKHPGEETTPSHTKINGYTKSSGSGDPDNSSSSLDDEELSPARTVQIYGTLPRKSKKKAKTTVPSSETSVYQDYLLKQKNASQKMSGNVGRSLSVPAPQAAQSVTSKYTSQPKHYAVNASTHAYNQLIYQQNSYNQVSQQVRPPSREGLLDGELMQKTVPAQRQYRPPSREGLLMEDGTQKTPCPRQFRPPSREGLLNEETIQKTSCPRQFRPPSREGLLSEETIQKTGPCQRPRPPSREGLLMEDGRQETAAYPKQFRPPSREGVLTEERLQQKPSSYQVTPGTAHPAQVAELYSHHKQTYATKAPYDSMIHTQLNELTLNSAGVTNRTTDSHHSAGVTNASVDSQQKQFDFDHNGFPVGKTNDRRRRGSEGSCIADDVTPKPWQPHQLSGVAPYEMNESHCVRQVLSGSAPQYHSNKNGCQAQRSGVPSYGYCNGKTEEQDKPTPVVFPKPSMIKKLEQQTRHQTASTVSGPSKKPQPPRKPKYYQQDVKSSNMKHKAFHPANYTPPVSEHIQDQETPATAVVSEEGIHKMSADPAQSRDTVDGSQSDYVKVTHNKLKPKVKDCKKTLGSPGKSSKKDTTGQYFFNCAESKLPKKAVDLDQCLTCKFSNAYCMCQTSVGNSYENNQQFSSFSALEDSTPTVSVISNDLNTASTHPAVPGQFCCTNPSYDVTNSECHCSSGPVESVPHPGQCVLPSYQKNVTDINCNQSVSGVTSQSSMTSKSDRTGLRNLSDVTSLSRSASVPDRIVSTLRSKTPDPKPALSKRKRRGGKRSKSVTFSDNIAYIGTLDEAAPTIDYIAYATEFLGRCQNRVSHQGSHEEAQPDTSSSDSEEDSYVPPTPDNSTMDKVRCNLCRRKFISTTEVYCVDCGHYMSKFHVPSS